MDENHKSVSLAEMENVKDNKQAKAFYWYVLKRTVNRVVKITKTLLHIYINYLTQNNKNKTYETSLFFMHVQHFSRKLNL